MSRLLAAAALLAWLPLAGCGTPAGVERGAEEKAKAPGQSSEAGKPGGIEIKTPGADVKIGKKGDIDVKAPGVHVDVHNDDSKVQSQAPGDAD